MRTSSVVNCLGIVNCFLVQKYISQKVFTKRSRQPAPDYMTLGTSGYSEKSKSSFACCALVWGCIVRASPRQRSTPQRAPKPLLPRAEKPPELTRCDVEGDCPSCGGSLRTETRGDNVFRTQPSEKYLLFFF